MQRLDMNDPGFWEKVLGAKPAQRLLNDLTQGKLDGAKAEAIEVYITGACVGAATVLCPVGDVAILNLIVL